MKNSNIKYWVVYNPKDKTYYATSYSRKYGKILTTCLAVEVAKRFKTKKMAEKVIWGEFSNFVAVPVLEANRVFNMNTRIVCADDCVVISTSHNKEDIEKVFKEYEELIKTRKIGNVDKG